MTPDAIQASYARQLDAAGETITLRRFSGTGSNRAFADFTARARVTDISARRLSDVDPGDLIGNMKQYGFVIVILASDLVDAGFPVPPRSGDHAIVRGKEVNIESVDENNRTVQGVIIAWELSVRG